MVGPLYEVRLWQISAPNGLLKQVKPGLIEMLVQWTFVESSYGQGVGGVAVRVAGDQLTKECFGSVHGQMSNVVCVLLILV